MGRLEGKSAVVTGGGTGIGRAASERFALEGARVVIAELNPDLAQETEQFIRDAGGDATFLQTDVTDEDQVEATMASVMVAHGSIDVLYNCAGGSITTDGKVDEIDLDAVYDHTMSLDLRGTMLCSRHAVPHMIASGGGAIVNMSSLAALNGVNMHVYSAAKGGVISLTRSMAASYARNGIRVNAICPGFVLTERVRERFGTAAGERPAQTDKTARRYPFGVGEPHEIANIALFLASDEARMITAAIVPADGGMSVY
ncbi:MAG: SDR family oxidoreductase [Acidimicrobiia bacterium]|nr:SDR family oxidoreductase [Acidimicrobiia bacterium]